MHPDGKIYVPLQPRFVLVFGELKETLAFYSQSVSLAKHLLLAKGVGEKGRGFWINFSYKELSPYSFKMKMGKERRAHLRESSLWDSALLSGKEIKKTAERTPATFRDEQLWDPLCITSVRAAELLFYTSNCGFMLFPLLPHGCNGVFTVTLL